MEDKRLSGSIQNSVQQSIRIQLQQMSFDENSLGSNRYVSSTKPTVDDDEPVKRRTTRFTKGDLVRLNVGGKVFQTTWDTLTKVTGTMLCAMFAGNVPVTLDDEGCVFIDRDGKFFKKILNFLRNGSIEVPSDRSTLLDLMKEAEFFQLNDLADILKSYIVDPPVGIAPHAIGKHVTVIKNESEKDLLLKSTQTPMVILEVSSSSFGEEKDAIIYKHLVLFDKLSSDYGDKILFVKQIVYTGKEWKFYAKGKLQHSVFFYNQWNGKHSFQEELILDRILKLILL